MKSFELYTFFRSFGLTWLRHTGRKSIAQQVLLVAVGCAKAKAIIAWRQNET